MRSGFFLRLFVFCGCRCPQGARATHPSTFGLRGQRFALTISALRTPLWPTLPEGLGLPGLRSPMPKFFFIMMTLTVVFILWATFGGRLRGPR